MSNSTQNETHSVCDERLAREGGKATCCYCDPHEGCTLGMKPYPGKFIPVDQVPEARKMIDRVSQEDWEKRYADMLKEFKRQTKIDMVADVLVMKSFISKEISYANQDGFDDGYGKGGMEGLKEGRADARKEVIRRIEAMPDKDVRPEITVWLESKEYCLGYNEALKNVLATLREEEKHG